jgi:hypothetical protein
MRRWLAGASLFILEGCAHSHLSRSAPSAADVQEIEEARIFEPLISYTPRGQRYVEWAPTVETRSAACTKIASAEYICTYESRSKDVFEPEFAPWKVRRERVAWRNKCWIRVTDQSF